MNRLARLVGPSLLVAIGVAVLLVPVRGATSEAQTRTESAQRLVDELAWDLDELSATAESADELRAANDELRAAVPDEHDVARVIIDLQDLAEVSGLSMLDVVPTSVWGSFDDPFTPTGSSSVVLAVALRGQFAELLDLLEAMAAHDRLFVVDAVALGVDEVTGELAIDLEVRVFTTEELVVFTDEFSDDEFPDEFADEEFPEEEVE